MRKLWHALTLALLSLILTVPLSEGATQLSKPTVTLPDQWQLTDEIPYPNSQSNHDPEGAGVVKYENPLNGDLVCIYYEKAQATTYSQEDLENEALTIFERNDLSENRSINDNGVTTFAGVSAGFAVGYTSIDETNVMEIVLVKGDYYMNVYAWYTADSQSEDSVISLVNSIETEGEDLSGSIVLWAAIGATVVVVVVVVFLSRRRRKRTFNKTASPYYLDVPPPPKNSSV